MLILNFINTNLFNILTWKLNISKLDLRNKMEKEMTCKECGKTFKYKFHPRYPRKFCDACSKKRKKAWENRHEMKFEDGVD